MIGFFFGLKINDIDTEGAYSGEPEQWMYSAKYGMGIYAHV